MTTDRSIIEILKDPATYRKAWLGAAVPLITGLIALYVPDEHLSLAEVLGVVAATLGTGATVFSAKNDPV